MTDNNTQNIVIGCGLIAGFYQILGETILKNRMTGEYYNVIEG